MTTMTLAQQIITIALCSFATILSRAIPFLIFKENEERPAFVQYLGKALPSAIFGMLIIYCFKDVSFIEAPHAIPELISVVFTIILHMSFRKMLLSIAGGTACYMLLLHFIF